ncbi:MAG: class I SAM-dependent methyltransferase [Rubrivivax sp.]
MRRRRGEVLAALPGAAGVPPERIHLRTRAASAAARSTTRRPKEGATCRCVNSGRRTAGANFSDYLDTGLFLDHRITRARLGAAAAGRRFLNLFCYTATASVHAARGGARSSLSLDMSNTYLDWAARNFRLNGVDPAQHRLERADCLAWLAAAAQAGGGGGGAAAASRPQFDLIFLDPPTFSHGKRMQGVLDVQRDHPLLVEQCMALLAAGGLLVFSTNAQRFRLDESIAGRWNVTDISAATLPFDFERNARIHRCYELRHAGAGR